ncbi:MAG: 5-nucleotidase, ecto [Thermoleophilia bacterium]|nr:5-nucleotidase, ecto [Thermoleophilia bacterium]
MTTRARLQAVLRQVDPPGAAIVFALEPSLVAVTGGVGGWEEIGHPKRPSSVEYAGQPLKTLTVEALFDGWQKQVSVEEPLRILGVWGRIPPGRREPAVLQLDYANHGAERWVLNGLDWGDSLRGSNGLRVRQYVTVTLLEYRDPAVFLSPVKRAAPVPSKPGAPGKPSSGAKPKPSGKTYTVKAGDTLQKIAQTQLGKAARWPELSRLNNLRDPNKLKVGQKLRIPA